MRNTITLILILIFPLIKSNCQNFIQRNSHSFDKIIKKDIINNSKRHDKNKLLNLYNRNGLLKLDSMIIYSLDYNEFDTILYPELKMRYVYNEDGNNTVSYEYEESDDILELDGETEKQYDDKKRLISITTYSYDSNLTKEPNYKESFFYFDNNLIKENVYSEYIDGNWNDIVKYEYSYDSIGRIILRVYSNTFSIDELQYNSKSEISYSDSLITELIYDYDIDKFNLIRKNETIINANTEITIGYLNNSDSTWVPSYKTEKLISSDGLEITETGFSWNSNNTNWEVTSFVQNIYNEIGNLVLEKFENLNADSTVQYGLLTEYNYHNDNTLNEIVYSEYSDIIEDYILDQKQVLITNSDFPRESLILPFNDTEEDDEIDIYFLHKLDKIYYYYYDNVFEEWNLEEIVNLHYSPLSPSSTTNKTISDVAVYPNPTSNYIHFDTHDTDLKSIVLYDSEGKLVKEISGNINKMDVSTLNKGMYFYTLILKSNEIQKGKILIVR